jgi:hypothetical protein
MDTKILIRHCNGGRTGFFLSVIVEGVHSRTEVSFRAWRAQTLRPIWVVRLSEFRDSGPRSTGRCARFVPFRLTTHQLALGIKKCTLQKAYLNKAARISSDYRGLGPSILVQWGTRQCSWLGHYATSRKVAGSRPDQVNELFQFT